MEMWGTLELSVVRVNATSIVLNWDVFCTLLRCAVPSSLSSAHTPSFIPYNT